MRRPGIPLRGDSASIAVEVLSLLLIVIVHSAGIQDHNEPINYS